MIGNEQIMINTRIEVSYSWSQIYRLKNCLVSWIF